MTENTKAYFLILKRQGDDNHQICILNLILRCLLEMVKFLGADTIYNHIYV
jgi:hypothetical protein